MVFGRLLPREGNFFELFNEHGQRIAEGARAFLGMVQNYADPAERERCAARVNEAEHAADKLTAEVHRLLHRTFITPLDRDQIHRLINAMDDVLDLLQDSGEVMSLYDLQTLSEDVLRMTEISVRCCERVQHVLTLLSRLKGPQDLWYAARGLARHRGELARGRAFRFLHDLPDMTGSQAALAYVLDDPGVSAAVFGATRPAHLRENLAASGMTLSQTLRDRIRAAQG